MNTVRRCRWSRSAALLVAAGLYIGVGDHSAASAWEMPGYSSSPSRVSEDAAVPGVRALYPAYPQRDSSVKRTEPVLELISHSTTSRSTVSTASARSPYYGDDGAIDLTVPPPVDGSNVQLAEFANGSLPDSPTAPTYQPPVVPPADEPWKPDWFKNGQATFFYAPATGNDDFGFVGFDTRATFRTPHPLFSISPRFGYMNTETDGLPQTLVISGAPATVRVHPYVPNELYDASVELRWFQPLSEQWMLDLAVSPGIYTDGDNTSGEAWRVIGRALAFYKWSESLSLAFGAVYLDRDDISVLPAAGLVATPSDDAKIELMFPRPKFAYRIRQQGNNETWAYLAGEFGGGQWATEENVAGVATGDLLQYRDYRFLFGLEQKDKDGLGWMVEGGFLFGREIEVNSFNGEFDLDSTAIIRFGGTF